MLFRSREVLAQTVRHFDRRMNMDYLADQLPEHLPEFPSISDSMIRVVKAPEMAKYYRERQNRMEEEVRKQREVVREKMDSARHHNDSLQQRLRESVERIKIQRLDSLKKIHMPDSQVLEDIRIDLNLGEAGKQRIEIDMRTFHKQIEEQTERMQEVFREMAFEYKVRFDSIRKNIRYEKLDTALSWQFGEKGMETDYAYAVWDQGQGKMLYHSPSFNSKAQDQAYQANLFPDDLIRKDVYLMVQIPKKTSQILRSVSYLLVGSLIFTLIIMITFALTIQTILRQKKLSEIKSDFINNMTHEFKTPIATISLAADSIANPGTLADRDKILNFLRIIKSENRRMNSQVERVLQMSLIDKREFELDIRPSHVHPLIEQVVDNIRLQLEKNGGEISYEPGASRDLVEVDQEHFLNVLYNLTDNAIKYSPGSPHITLMTENRRGNLRISVEDQGMGIRQEDQQRIFHKFFRVSTGNIHNVKGFGLGLSYVKTMVQEFGGDIQVHSQYGKGSRFEIYLPLKKGDDEEK